MNLADGEAKKRTRAGGNYPTDGDIHPLRLCEEIKNFMQREAILSVDGQEILNYGFSPWPKAVLRCRRLEWLRRVEPGGLVAVAGIAGIGASRPLRRIPAIVSFLNLQPALSLVGGNRSSCPLAVI